MVFLETLLTWGDRRDLYVLWGFSKWVLKVVVGKEFFKYRIYHDFQMSLPRSTPAWERVPSVEFVLHVNGPEPVFNTLI